MSRAKRLTKAKTEKAHSSVGIQAVEGEELTDITAEAVRPVRTVRFAVMNLFSELVMEEYLWKGLDTFQSFRCPLQWFSSRLS